MMRSDNRIFNHVSIYTPKPQNRAVGVAWNGQKKFECMREKEEEGAFTLLTSISCPSRVLYFCKKERLAIYTELIITQHYSVIHLSSLYMPRLIFDMRGFILSIVICTLLSSAVEIDFSFTPRPIGAMSGHDIECHQFDCPIIALEEHFASSKSLETQAIYAKFPSHIISKLKSLDEERIRDMDKGRVSLQIISHGCGDLSPTLCTAVNDDLAAAIAKNPNRLAGFATLPMGDPAEAASELERCIRHLPGFVGALIDSHLADGQFYDNERFWPVFAKAEDLDVPVYIHPTFASDSMMEQHYEGNYSDSVALALSAFGWGWHVETGLSILRLFASGLFDRFPHLKIIIGHMGELLPFQIDRVFAVSDNWGGAKRQRGLREVWRNNLYITTSGMFSLAPLACLLQTMPIDHVLYSIDYPFSPNEKGFDFLEEICKSGLIKGEDLELFAFRNAETLLRVKAVK